jgi:hypothetical protein
VRGCGTPEAEILPGGSTDFGYYDNIWDAELHTDLGYIPFRRLGCWATRKFPTGISYFGVSASCTMLIMRRTLEGFTLIESMPTSTRKWAISG